MDDFGAPSLFDYATGAHASISSTLEISSSGGLDAVVKQETFDSSAWIQGYGDTSTVNGFNQQTSFQPLKTNFLQTGAVQDPMGLESLINGPPVRNTPPVSASLDPLELILNQPPAVTTTPFSVVPQSTVLDTSTIVKSEGTSDLAILNALNAFPTHDPPQGQIASNVTPTHNALQGQVAGSEANKPLLVGNNVSQMPQTHEDTQKQDVTVKIEPTQPEPEPVPVVPKEVDPEKDLNLTISNVVTSFRVRCHLNLRRIAQEGINVIYQKESKKIVMRVRHPSCTAYIWSSGKVICTGANSESNAKKASKKFAKRLQNIGFQVRFTNYKVINVLAVCKMPYHIDIVNFSEYYRSKYLSYEPEIHPAVTYRMPEFKVTFKIFSTGSITLTCPVIVRIPEAIKKVYPMVSNFFKFDHPNDLASLRNIRQQSDVEEEGKYDS